MRKSPIFDNNTQLSLLLTCDHEQKILSTDFYFFWLIHMTRDQEREKKKGGVWIYRDCPPTPVPQNNKGMLDNGHPYFAREF